MDKTKRGKTIAKLLGYFMFALLLLAILYTRFNIGTIIRVSGSSMEPNFHDGEFVFATVLDADDELKQNDVIILLENERFLIKRVYGTPNTTTIANPARDIPAVELGDNEYYVLGDNYLVSRDSRSFGPITRDAILYKYAGITWNETTLLISVVIPVVLLIAAFSIAFIPAERSKKSRMTELANQSDEEESIDNIEAKEDTAVSTPDADVATSDINIPDVEQSNIEAQPDNQEVPSL